LLLKFNFKERSSTSRNFATLLIISCN